jgi:hypothetical protein
MKNYKIFYAKYPFNMETVKPLFEIVEARNLNDAFAKMKDMYGESIEIFREQARKFYKE